ncbi:MAG: polysaccharide biosynthesis protein [Rhodocyclales bacterium]|nr:polysaccharide biosynthesis protein [Rhodocyclales bacterium]
MTSSQGEIKRFLQHSGIYTIGNTLNRLGAFLLLPLYTNYLTTAEYGALELFYTVAAVVSGILSVGIAHATLRFYFEYANESDRNAVVSTNLIASLAISVAGATVVLMFGDEINQEFFSSGEYGFALQLVFASMVLDLSSQIGFAYLRAREHSIFFVSLSLGKLIVQVVANVVLVAHFKAGVEGVLIGNLLAVAAGWIVLVGFTVRRCGIRFQFGKLIPVLKYSLPFLLSTMVSIVTSNVDRFLINELLTLEILGVYALALKFAKLISDLIGEPFNRAYGSFRFSIMDRADAADIQARIVRYLSALLAFVALGVIYFTGDLLRLIAAEQYWSAGSLMPLLVLAACLQVLTYPMQTGVLYQKATRHIFWIGLAQAVIGVALGYILIRLFGVTGACLSLAVIAAIGMGLTHRASQRYFPVHYEYRRLFWILGTLVLFYVASLPLGNLPLVASVGAKLLLLTGFVLVLLRSPAFSSDEISYARTAVRRFLKRSPEAKP